MPGAGPAVTWLVKLREVPESTEKLTFPCATPAFAPKLTVTVVGLWTVSVLVAVTEAPHPE
jgi:hypothetical protein